MHQFDKDMEHLNVPTIIPVDEDYGRRGSDEEDYDTTGDSAFSVASSIHNFRIEHGRRYHDYKHGHPFPYDEVSEENEIVMHEMCLVLFDNRYFVSPISDDQISTGNICDVGTGLGLWAEGIAEKYPDATIVGMDTAPHPRGTEPNCSFIIANAEEEWVLDDMSMKFDLVFIRSLSVGVQDWPALYHQCFINMKSGGWIEQIEVEIDANSDYPSDPEYSFVRECAKIKSQMSETSGREYDISFRMKEFLEEAGFVDVQRHRFKLPLGHWSTDPKYKDVGRFFERFYKTGLQGWLLQICTRNMGWSVDQVNDVCIRAFKEINERKHHLYFSLIVGIGRKP